MPRGFGRGYGRFNRGYERYGFSPFGGVYGLVDILFLIGILYFMVKLFIVAAPYALGLGLLLLLRAAIRPRPGRFFW